MEQLYINIKNRRKELGMTQEQLAHKIGYTDRSMIAKIESGVVDINISTMKKIAKALNTEPIELIRYLWDDEEENNAKETT